ncbi:unnamed protein product [Prorocentrum cordatum]|uniref:Uncharacterized protein n=1 Tax=Prorocentrum cordatum TaxID=2364126 RepID=A0ABN9W1H1_9DINO|nr:unnamed protein product [Polarella glacialis]
MLGKQLLTSAPDPPTAVEGGCPLPMASSVVDGGVGAGETEPHQSSARESAEVNRRSATREVVKFAGSSKVLGWNMHLRTGLFPGIKVGQLRLSPTRLVSAATYKSTAAAQMSIEFLNAEGTIGLSRPYSDAGTLGLNEDAVLKILEDQDMVVTDVDCAENGYDPTLVDGLSSAVDASLNYKASLQTETPADPTKLVFNSNSFVNVISVKKPGNIAIWGGRTVH